MAERPGLTAARRTGHRVAFPLPSARPLRFPMTDRSPPPDAVASPAAALRRALRDLVRAQARRDRARAGARGLTAAGVHALEVLAERGAVSLRALAAALCVDDSTASRTVGLLEDRGYLARSADPRDGRAIRVGLTAPGRALEARLRDDALHEAEAALAAVAPAERAAGLAFLDRLAVALADGPGEVEEGASIGERTPDRPAV